MGVRVTDVRPDCMIDAELINRFRREWDDLPRPKVIVNRNAGPWTGNKVWPDELWDDLIHRLAASGRSSRLVPLPWTTALDPVHT